jgi:hypothetical protein
VVRACGNHRQRGSSAPPKYGDGSRGGGERRRLWPVLLAIPRDVFEMVGVRKVRVKLLDRALGTLFLVVEWRQTETCG